MSGQSGPGHQSPVEYIQCKQWLALLYPRSCSRENRESDWQWEKESEYFIIGKVSWFQDYFVIIFNNTAPIVIVETWCHWLHNCAWSFKYVWWCNLMFTFSGRHWCLENPALSVIIFCNCRCHSLCDYDG